MKLVSIEKSRDQLFTSGKADMCKFEIKKTMFKRTFLIIIALRWTNNCVEMGVKAIEID